MAKPTPQEIQDMRDAPKLERAYNKSLTSTEPAPKPASPAKPARPAGVQEMLDEVNDAKMRKKISDMGYKKGGSVGSASKRGDGIAQRGKTRGKLL